MSVSGGLGISSMPIKGDAAIGISMSMMSYGKLKTNPDITILDVGVGAQLGSQRPVVMIAPINYNIGKLLPGNIANNTYIGPTLQVNTAGNVLIGGALSVGF